MKGDVPPTGPTVLASEQELAQMQTRGNVLTSTPPPRPAATKLTTAYGDVEPVWRTTGLGGAAVHEPCGEWLRLGRNGRAQ